MLIDGRLGAIIFDKPPFRAKPHKALPVLYKRIDGIVGQAMLGRQVFESGGGFLGVEPGGQEQQGQ